MVFDYLNRPGVALRFNRVRQDIRQQLTYIQEDVIAPSWAARAYPNDPDYPLGGPPPNIVDWWDQWFPDYFEHRARQARDFLTDAAGTIRAAYDEIEDAGGRDQTEDGLLLNTSEDAYIEIGHLLARAAELAFPPDTSGSGNPQRRDLVLDSGVH